MRRRGQTKGFAMAEALVALAVAAMTLALLTSATWGLSITVERRAAAQATGAAEWLAARRALMGWASGVTVAARESAESRFIGTASTARIYVEPSGSGLAVPFVGELRVEVRGDEEFALIAARHSNIQDARVVNDETRSTEVLQANRPIRLLYLLPQRSGGVQRGWRYETGSGADGLPLAIAIEVGNERMLTSRIFATMSASCLADRGRGGLESEECELR